MAGRDAGACAAAGGRRSSGRNLLYPDGKVQHAGMFLATRGIARHAFRFAAADEARLFRPGADAAQRHRGDRRLHADAARASSRRSGGFDEAHQIINNDLDFCLRAHRAGQADRLYAVRHADPPRGGQPRPAEGRIRSRSVRGALEALCSPPAIHISARMLSRHADDYRPDDEPVETIFAGHPLFRHADIKRILAVKLDHIGDFITALPAIRRLKQIFPAASIHVLASRAARAFAGMEDCIDEFIEFEFFHAVSGLGSTRIGAEEYQALRDAAGAVSLRPRGGSAQAPRYARRAALHVRRVSSRATTISVSSRSWTSRWSGRATGTCSASAAMSRDDLINLVEAIGTAGGGGAHEPRGNGA